MNQTESNFALTTANFKGRTILLIGEKGIGKSTTFKSMLTVLDSTGWETIKGLDKISADFKDGTEKPISYSGFVSYPGIGTNYTDLDLMHHLSELDEVNAVVCFMVGLTNRDQNPLVQTVQKLLSLLGDRIPVVFVFNKTSIDINVEDAYNQLFPKPKYNNQGYFWFQKYVTAKEDDEKVSVDKFLGLNRGPVQSMLEALEKINTKVEIKLAAPKRERILKLDADLEAANEKIRTLESEKSNLSQQVNELTTSLVEKENQIKLKDTIIKEKSEAYDKVVERLAENVRKLASLEIEMSELESKKKSLQQQNDKLSLAIQSTEREITKLTIWTNSLHEKMSELEIKKQSLQQQNDELSLAVQSTESEIKRLKIWINDLHENYKKNDEELRKFKASLLKSVGELVKDYKSYVRFGAIPVAGLFQLLIREYKDLSLDIKQRKTDDVITFQIKLNSEVFTLNFLTRDM